MDSPVASPLRLESWSTVSQSAGVPAEVTVNVAGTTAGEPCAPAAVTVTLPEYDPTGRPATVELTVRVCGAVPLVGETESQLESDAAVKESVPEPEFVTDSEPGVGSGPPCVVVNDRLGGETARIGCVAVVPDAYTDAGLSA
jgi:hypothetical protein